MQELTKVFNGIPLKIEMIDDREFMVDITSIAASYGKNITEWSESKRVMQKIAVLDEWGIEYSELDKMSKKELLEFKKTLKGKSNLPQYRGSIDTIAGANGYSKIHNRLLIDFARFISIEFDIWCDKMIFDILTGKKQLQLENQTKMLKEVENKYAKQISDLKCEVNKKTQHKLIAYADQTQNNLNYKGLRNAQ